MEKRYKAQVSVEMLAIVGVVILGALVFASYYLSSVNRNIDNLEELDPDFSELLPNTPGGTFPGIELPGGGGGNSLCGNNIINLWEQCDGANLNGESCNSLGFGAGSLTCNTDCTFNAGGCDNFSAGCGNNILEASEECEMNNFSDPANPMYNNNPSCTAYCMDQGYATGSGDVSCNAGTCGVDYSSCVCSNNPFSAFLLLLLEDSASANPDVGYPTHLSVDFDPDGTGAVSSWVDVNVIVQNEFGLYSNVCKYDDILIPADENGLFIKRFQQAESTVDYIKDISCSENGVYTFTFKGVDDLGNVSSPDPTFTFTVPLQDPAIFALCDSETNTNGSFNACINRYSGEASNGSGDVAFFVNQPDAADSLDMPPACVSSVLGEVCFSLGFN